MSVVLSHHLISSSDIFRNDDMTIDEDHLLLVQLFPGEMLCHTCLCASLQSICLRDVAVFTY